MREEKIDPVLDKSISRIQLERSDLSTESSSPDSTPKEEPKPKETKSSSILSVDENEKVASVVPLFSSLGQCNIPAYFAEDESLVRKCTTDLAVGLFKSALIINICFSLLFFKNLSTTFMLGFVIFHIFLYFFTTRLLVSISLGEWKTFQAYKLAVKKDPDFSRFDTPLTQFRTITTFLMEQPINKQKMIYLILIISFLFVWLPVMFNIGGEGIETRFDLSKLRRNVPVVGS